MLAAKVYEDRIVLIETENIDYLRTNYLKKVLEPYQSDNITFLTSFEPDDKFLLSAKNLSNVRI